jgi:hypothetical protein
MAACDVFDSILADPDLRLDMLLEPGDIQFANNYAVLHSRTGFEDHEDPAQRRKLLRLWLKMAEPRQLAPDFPGATALPRAWWSLPETGAEVRSGRCLAASIARFYAIWRKGAGRYLNIQVNPIPSIP